MLEKGLTVADGDTRAQGGGAGVEPPGLARCRRRRRTDEDEDDEGADLLERRLLRCQQ